MVPGESIKYDPLPLPKTRKRRLSYDQLCCQQASILLTRVPFDVRYIIYKHVIQDEVVHRHVTEQRVHDSEGQRQRNRIRGRRCRLISQSLNNCVYCTRTSIDLEYQCFSSADNWIDYCMPGKCGGGPLALSKVCRQIYIETIDMQYS